MDITFEEVAFVIQDARYQQAIFDSDVPKPDKKFPLPPRNFNPLTFMKEQNIGLHSVVFEPIGRFFLTLVAQDTEEHEMLRFTDSISELRKMDPAGFIQIEDIEAICERFHITLIPLQSIPEDELLTDALKNEQKESQTGDDSGDSSVFQEGRISTTGSPIQFPKRLGDPTPPASMTHFTNNINNNNNDREDSYVEKRESRLGGSKLMSFESAVPQRFDDRQDLSNNQAMSTFYRHAMTTSTSHANTYSAAVAAAITRKLVKTGKQHSRECINMNFQVTATIERKLQSVYERLVEDKKLWAMYINTKWYSVQPITEKHVRYHRVLGMGAFGTVNGCVVMSIGVMLAMKSMNKKRIKAKKAKNQVTAERDALEALAAHSSPYCLKLRYSYETKEAYHFILPLAIAGDLKHHLKDGPFSIERARCYAAEVALGLGHLHSLGLVIRDLKPRNILLTSRGHCQISDFGLAVEITEKRPLISGRAGTEGYWSPEVINNLPYSTDADWWSYGVCLFEFLGGVSPFSCKHTGLKTRNDGTRKAEIKFTEQFPESAKPLVCALLNRNVAERLQGVNTVLDEEKWEFWRNFNLGLVRRNELPPPWLPEKGHIYAASQGEIQENDDPKETRKVKILPEDSIPFSSFIDFEGHQRDIVKVLEVLKAENRLSVNTVSGVGSPSQGKKGSACVIV